jgi:large subunit ribosomal protein L7/L12
MADQTKLIEEISKLSVLEVSELVKALEEKFGVSAAPVAVAGAAAPAAAEEAAEEKTEFDVVITAAGDSKIGAIKAVREIKSDLGLVEAKELVEKAPVTLLEKVKKEEAEEAKKKLEAAGAKVELK